MRAAGSDHSSTLKVWLVLMDVAGAGVLVQADPQYELSKLHISHYDLQNGRDKALKRYKVSMLEYWEAVATLAVMGKLDAPWGHLVHHIGGPTGSKPTSSWERLAKGSALLTRHLEAFHLLSPLRLS